MSQPVRGRARPPRPVSRGSHRIYRRRGPFGAPWTLGGRVNRPAASIAPELCPGREDQPARAGHAEQLRTNGLDLAGSSRAPSSGGRAPTAVRHADAWVSAPRPRGLTRTRPLRGTGRATATESPRGRGFSQDTHWALAGERPMHLPLKSRARPGTPPATSHRASRLCNRCAGALGLPLWRLKGRRERAGLQLPPGRRHLGLLPGNPGSCFSSSVSPVGCGMVRLWPLDIRALARWIMRLLRAAAASSDLDLLRGPGIRSASPAALAGRQAFPRPR